MEQSMVKKLNERLYCLEQALNNVKEGILISDKDNRIIFYNKEMAKLDGLNQNEVIGKKISEVYKVDHDHNEHIHVFKTGEPIEEGNRIYYTTQGNEVDLVYKTLPIFQDDRIIGVYSLCRNVAKLKELLERTMQLQRSYSEDNLNTRSGLNNMASYTFDDIIGNSQVMNKLKFEAIQIASSITPILITGETGTGKELFAQSIHNYSQGNTEPFLAINCAAIPENLLESLLFGTIKGAFTGAADMSGFFEQAGEGTLFLDEINSMPLSLQAKLLRVLQERRARRIGSPKEYSIRCRIISSTNRDPLISVEKQEMRSDLYYRLSGLVLTIPPLREHKEDIRDLIDYYVKKYRLVYKKGSFKLSKELTELLEAYNWPGNIRQLQHIIENLLLRADKSPIGVDSLPTHFQRELLSYTKTTGKPKVMIDLNQQLAEYEKNIIAEILKKTKWNISKSANQLGLNRQNLQYKIKKYDLKKSDRQR